VHWDSGGFAEKSSFSRAGGESKRRKWGLSFNQLKTGSKADFVGMSASGAKEPFIDPYGAEIRFTIYL
jgi:hypothetical protein